MDTAAEADKPGLALMCDNFYSPQNRDFYDQAPYQNLDPTQQQIRFLRFLPSDNDAVLSFTLFGNGSLDSVRSRYTALSYCAGDPKSTKAIYVHGVKLNAFSNLEYTLREVVEYWRNNGKHVDEELLWADQICINQSSLEERSHQVGQMRDIYAAADQVLMALATKDCEARSGIGIEWLKELRVELQTICGGEMPLIPNAEVQEGFIDFCQLLRSPWLERGWIYQEFIVASDAVFLYEGSLVNRRDLNGFLTYLVDENLGIFGALSRSVQQWYYYEGRPGMLITIRPPPSDGQLSRLDQCRDAYDLLAAAYLLVQKKSRWVGPTGLMDWLNCGRICQTSDPRDRVYAFLGLAHPRYNIIPNCSPSNTIENLTLEVARKVLDAEGNLNFLLYVRKWPYSDDYPRPTWVPHLQVLRSNKGSVLDQEIVSTISNPKSTRANASIDKFGTILTTEGIRLDTMPHGVLQSVFRQSAPTDLTTTRGLSIKWARYPRFGEGVCVWWFPGSSFVAVLAPKKTFEPSSPSDTPFQSGHP